MFYSYWTTNLDKYMKYLFVICSEWHRLVQCRDLKNIQEIWHTILIIPKAIFLWFSALFWQVGNTVLYLKKNYKNELHFSLEACIFYKRFQTVCLINTHICCQHARLDSKLWSALWFYHLLEFFTHTYMI